MRESPDLIRENTPPATGASPMARLKTPIAWLKIIVGPDWMRTYGIATGMALVLCFTGANGTNALPLAPRFLYWLSLMAGGTIIAQIAGRLLDRYTNLNLWQTITVMMLCITPLITILAWLVTAGVNHRAPQVETLIVYIPPVLVISLAMTGLHVLVSRQPVQSHAFATAQTLEPGVAFRERLPFKHRHADIFALAAEDHYLRVHTSAGETLILMRLYDAIRELDGIEGSQVHRSWWVAKDAIADVIRSDGRISFSLKGGLSAPVSRSYQKALKQDGWL
ncbi:hypothetical protein AEAC466_00830 [Asticcacaulis sp. AC466]|nr:hypothetical protein AEAC466_00830 [Asticcacaulis sp. AC466]